MKKLIAIVFTLALFTGCENEPLDGDFNVLNNPNIPTDPTDPNDPGSGSTDLALSVYELDTDISLSFFGFPIQTITNSDITITNNIITSSEILLTVVGSPTVAENQTITRNGFGQIISDISTTPSGVVTNEYFITNMNNNISQITHNYYDQEDPSFDEGYVYNFTYNGSIITRTVVNSTIETVFTLDGSGRLIKKESFDNSMSIQKEELTYNGDGNVSSSLLTGDREGTLSFNYDTFDNPLKVVYDEQYLLSFLSDEYDDEIGSPLVHFHSTRNWSGTTIDGDTFNFILQYDANNRIIIRDISYNNDGGLSFVIDERFNYVN
ncbi:MAG: hypothetical protein QNK89_06195 [Lacinutrix sp.]|uniref:hypothetical protein n=1 Tax=Lacinutrix sp. TaxID=1937692 RepID=UPI0030A5A57E